MGIPFTLTLKEDWCSSFIHCVLQKKDLKFGKKKFQKWLKNYVTHSDYHNLINNEELRV